MPAAQLQGKPLGAIGSAGQNTQLTDIDLPPQFGTVVVNAFLNESGKLTARKSFDRVTADNSDLVTTNPIQRVYRHIKANGTSVLMCAGNGRIFSSDGATLTSRSSGHTTNNWQFASLNGQIFAAQVGKTMRSFDDDGANAADVTDPAAPVAIHAAFGRLWALTSSGNLLEWSDILDGDDFAAGDSGVMDTELLHQSNKSPGVAVVSFNRQIVVLCSNQIIVFGLAEDGDPNNATQPIFLRDVIPNVGCVARDSVVVAGEDILFLSADGVRSLSRSLSEKEGPSPMIELSALNKNALVRNIDTETLTNVTACWHPGESWYQLFLPATQEIWLFDMSSKIEGTPTPKTFIWRTGATRPIYCGHWFSDDRMYYGCVGGLARNDTYDTDDSYNMVVTSGWMSLGAPDSLKHFKKLILSLTGGGGQDATVKWYVDFDDNNVRTRTFTLETAADPDEYNVGEYNVAEFSSGLGTAAFGIHLSNSAQFIKIEITLPVSASLVTINNAQMLYQLGRVRG